MKKQILQHWGGLPQGAWLGSGLNPVCRWLPSHRGAPLWLEDFRHLFFPKLHGPKPSLPYMPHPLEQLSKAPQSDRPHHTCTFLPAFIIVWFSVPWGTTCLMSASALSSLRAGVLPFSLLYPHLFIHSTNIYWVSTTWQLLVVVRDTESIQMTKISALLSLPPGVERQAISKSDSLWR